MSNNQTHKFPRIALCGRAGSGKSALAKMFAEKYGYQVVSFAAGIKECFNEIFVPVLGRPIDKAVDRGALVYIGEAAKKFFDHDSYGNLFDFEKQFGKKNKLDDQKLYKLFDTYDTWVLDKLKSLGYPIDDSIVVPKDYSKDIWIKLMLQQVEKETVSSVIDDLRFSPERDTLRSNGFMIVRLNVSKEVAEARLTVRDGGFDPNIWDNRTEKEFAEFEANYDINAERPIQEVFEEIERALFVGQNKLFR